MPVKGILKKPPPPPSEEQPIDNVVPPAPGLSTTLDRSSSLLSSSSSPTAAPTTKTRAWLNKLRSSVMSRDSAAHQQQQTRPQERKRTIRYNKMVIVHETYTRHEYNREPDPSASCTYLTAEAAQEIKNELNFFKFNEMIVHPTSRIYTHFFV
ncbi:hypothetical protein BDB00DRAFT_822334 [Zychaea mexicana]|uniref:uncharacterized protein n=1 Tax=Zychaea mexicana TaxID=64656 RepID=UPI0022FEE0BC|nr:uncharacterized protein BDB00DRAFT_822334 [Zychaea mexicana]KAI9493534.1 hypothetical protein BDB00DRAFT_822334 [Zychaea mexicana]